MVVGAIVVNESNARGELGRQRRGEGENKDTCTPAHILITTIQSDQLQMQEADEAQSKMILMLR